MNFGITNRISKVVPSPKSSDTDYNVVDFTSKKTTVRFDRSILHRYWKQACGCSWLGFIIYQLAIEYDNQNNVKPLCPYSKDNYPLRYWYITLIVFGGNIQLWSTLLVRIARSMPNKRPLYCIGFSIISMGSTSTALTLFSNWGGICIDTLGVGTSTALWGEWLLSGPLILIATVAFANKMKLSNFDWLLIVSFMASIILGFVIIPQQPYALGVVWLILSCICFIPTLLLPKYKHCEDELISDSDIQSSPVSMLSMETQSRHLSLVLAITFSLYPINYFLGMLRVLGTADTIAIYQILTFLSTNVFIYFTLNVSAEEVVSVSNLLLAERKSNESKRTFLKYVFHEVRGPLSSLTMGVDILKANVDLNESDIETLNMMKCASTFMNDTLNGVLNMQKIEEGKFELEMSSFDIRDSLKKMCHTYSGATKAKNISLDTHISHDVPSKLIGDSCRLEHVIGNLLSNAIKFSRLNGTIDIEVTCELSPVGKASVTISIIDQGAGISEENQKKLFQEFVQIKAGQLQQGGGSGLGLSFCKKVVNLHGGSIGVKSVEGEGSNFLITIPFKADSLVGTTHRSDPKSLIGTHLLKHLQSRSPSNNASVHLTESIRSDASSAKTPPPPQIALVVDDVATNRKMLCMLLRKKGVESAQAVDGQEALDIVKLSPDGYKLIFIDNMMPVMNGLDATRELRKSGYPYLIIGVTGNVMDDDVKKFIVAGADMVLPKPLNIELLDAILKFIQCNGSYSKHTHGKVITYDKVSGCIVWNEL